jgi:hypothetical protein
LRNELEFFFNKYEWPVSELPDPQDDNPQRYAVLAVLPALMVRAFNRLIAKGLPRDSGPIISDFEELAARPRILEAAPSWPHSVPRLNTPLKVPNKQGIFIEGPADPESCKEFLEKNIWIEEPHIYFV